MIKNNLFPDYLECYEDISLKKYNSYHLDTICRYLIFPKTIFELMELLNIIKREKIKYLVLGNGSNVIFKNNYYDGIIIRLDYLNNLIIKDNLVEVEAGYSLIKLSLETANKSLSGLEFAAGIPGQIGSSVAMNAGAYNDSLGNYVKEVEVLTPTLERKWLNNKDLEFSYRNSFFKHHKNYLIIKVRLELNSKNKEDILSLIEDRRKRRLVSQPLNYPSAGSVFRNPEGLYAGKLIEDLGLKGYQINGAEISSKHANFIINKNNATGEDIIKLINFVKDKVYQKYQIKLHLEQEIIE